MVLRCLQWVSGVASGVAFEPRRVFACFFLGKLGFSFDGRASRLAGRGSFESPRGSLAMSALPPKADMYGAVAHVRFGPIADMGCLRGGSRSMVLKSPADRRIASMKFALIALGPVATTGVVYAACILSP